MSGNQTQIVKKINTGKKISNGLKIAKEHAKSKNGQCLSIEYINSHSKLEWKCENRSHSSWFARYTNVVHNKTWCPDCKKENHNNLTALSHSLSKAKDYAISKKGECLTRERVNGKEHLEWKCENPNHSSWFAPYKNVVNLDCWCPQCSKEIIRQKKNIFLDKAKTDAVSKNGQCLSIEYINEQSKLEWKCKKPQHLPWFSKYANIRRGSWCPECAKESFYKINKLKNGLAKAKAHAISKGGKCLSFECLDSQSKLEWKCNNDQHNSWLAAYTNVVNNDNWCRQCRIELDFPKEKYFKIAQEHAISKGGKCLSAEYINNNTKMEWKCNNPAHPSWWSVYSSVISGDTWCPECCLTYNLKEFKVQQILNYLFKTQFIKNRSLSWNINPKTNYILELDGYCDKLKIAFEFQGNYHFKDNIFKGTNLEDIQYKDKVKKENCDNNGIQLIIIDEIRTKNCLKFFNQILASIKKSGITPPLYDYSEIERLYKLRPDTKE